MSECLFADDAALIYSSKGDMIVAANIFDEVSEGRMQIDIKCALDYMLLVAGVGLSSINMAPLRLCGGAVEVVKEFKYLESVVEATSRMIGGIDHHIVQTSKAFGSLCSAVFMAHDISLVAKGLVYCSVVLEVLLCIAQKRGPLHRLVRELEWFHHCCINYTMGIVRAVQWAQHITTAQLAKRFGMKKSIGHLLDQSRLRWLGHLQ